jgi:proteasome beta subunit
MQVLTKEVGAYLNIYEYEREQKPSVKSAAKVMGNLLFERRLFPYLTQTIIGGLDEQEGASLFVLDPVGSVIGDKFTSVGSGSEIAIGVLEGEYKDGMSIDDGKALVKKAIKAASSRDIGSGEAIDVLVVGKNGMHEEVEKLR